MWNAVESLGSMSIPFLTSSLACYCKFSESDGSTCLLLACWVVEVESAGEPRDSVSYRTEADEVSLNLYLSASKLAMWAPTVTTVWTRMT